MAKPKRPGGPKQKLSPKAAKAKAARDLKIAKTPRRTKMRLELQKKRREAEKAGKSIQGLDFDHNRNKFVSEKTNRSATKTTNNTLDPKTKKKVEKKLKKGIKASEEGKHKKAARKFRKAHKASLKGDPNKRAKVKALRKTTRGIRKKK